MRAFYLYGTLACFTLVCSANSDSGPSDSRFVRDLAGKRTALEITMRKTGGRQVNFELDIAAPMDLTYAARIATDLGNYASWLLPGINQRRNGKRYSIEVLGIENAPGDPSHMRVRSRISLPFLSLERTQNYRVRVFRQSTGLLVNADQELAADSPLESMSTSCQLAPVEGDPHRAWIHCQGKGIVKSWLVYQVLPIEGTLVPELKDRIACVGQLYREEEKRLAGQIGRK